MKVCMVAYTFYEGDNRVRRYAESLAARGDHVDVFALRQEGSGRRTRLQGVNIYKIQRRPVNERKQRDYLLRLLMFMLRSAWHLTLRFAAQRYDLVHVHSIPDFEVFAGLIPKLGGAKIVLDIHDIVPELYVGKFGVGKKSPLFKALVLVERLSASFADHVVIANDIWHERIISRSVRGAKCSVIMNYPDPSLFSRRPQVPHPGKFILLYPGTLSRHQGLGTAIEAVDILRERIPGLELHIYGSGTDEQYFVKMVKDRALEDKVLFKGLITIDLVADVMAQADLGVEPKSSEGFGDEAFSTKILEFLMVGTPVVVSDTRVHQLYLTDKEVKFFRAGNSGELAEGIGALYQSPELRRGYTERGLAFMSENNWAVKKGVYFNLVDSLIKTKPMRHRKAATS
ncbi:MAG: glycosyltransferase [Chitinivibrionales bacterium]|nr:glycosyltransferase [Chitinivibrionales bacterium]MBD3358240.1 glycosyltransferase [Chitinivibrionales bacterium]